MEQQEVLDALRPKLSRLKQLGSNLEVGRVHGSRVLVKPVTPLTELDRYSRTLTIPQHLKREYTPLPTTGIVIQTGPAMPCDRCGKGRYDGGHIRYVGPDADAEDASPSEYHFWRPAIKEGDMVMFPRLAGVDFTLGSGEGPKEEGGFMILEARDIMCTFVDNTALGLEVVEVEEEER